MSSSIKKQVDASSAAINILLATAGGIGGTLVAIQPSLESLTSLIGIAMSAMAIVSVIYKGIKKLVEISNGNFKRLHDRLDMVEKNGKDSHECIEKFEKTISDKVDGMGTKVDSGLKDITYMKEQVANNSKILERLNQDYYMRKGAEAAAAKKSSEKEE